MKEGVIKFKYELKKKALSASLDIGELVKYRNKLRCCTERFLPQSSQSTQRRDFLGLEMKDEKINKGMERGFSMDKRFLPQSSSTAADSQRRDFLGLEIRKDNSELPVYGLIGADENGVGYGNISVRYKTSRQFIISASDTGKIKRARRFHFTMVNSVDIKKNFVSCTGMRAASSESMTHDIIYNLSSGIKCVIHVHNRRLWKKLLNKVPTTSKSISYGTSEMANDIRRLWVNSDLKEKRILVMAGHEGGLVVFGESIEEAYSLIMEYFNG
ncbi:MAG: class II aldolase/adducin family protein [Ignavibacteria bacterium]